MHDCPQLTSKVLFRQVTHGSSTLTTHVLCHLPENPQGEDGLDSDRRRTKKTWPWTWAQASSEE